jgi:hypothetical protein
MSELNGSTVTPFTVVASSNECIICTGTLLVQLTSVKPFQLTCNYKKNDKSDLTHTNSVISTPAGDPTEQRESDVCCTARLHLGNVGFPNMQE